MPSAAEHSLALRVAGATRAEVRAALAAHELVRTYGPRGTVHLLPAADLARWGAALDAVPRRSPHADGVRLDDDQTDAVVAGIDTALAGADLTVDELTAALGDLVGAWAVAEVMPAFQGLWPRWRQATTTAAHRGVLCFGAGRGHQVTYTSPRRWHDLEPVAQQDAVPWLVDCYLRAFGPATAGDFAAWTAAPQRWAATAFAEAGVEAVADGAVVAAGDARWEDAEPRDGLRLLPYFDAYVVGARPRPLVYPGRAAERALVPSGQAGNYPVLLRDGVVAGVWHGRRSGRRLTVTVEPLGRLTAAEREALEEQVARTGDVLEARAELTVGEVAVGPHA